MTLPPGGYMKTAVEYLTDCPFCGKDAHFYYNVARNKGECKVCHRAVGSRRSMLRAFGLDDADDDHVVFIPPKLQTFSRKQMLGMIPAWHDREARSYLRTRQVTEQQCRDAGIMWHAQTGKLVVQGYPVSEGMPMEYLVRNIRAGGKWILNDPGPRYREYGFGHAQLRPDLKGLVLFEGIFDMLATDMLGHALAICGSFISRTWAEWIRKRVDRVVVWLDPDESGYAGRDYALWVLKGEQIHTAWIQGRDPKLLRPSRVAWDREFLDMLRQFTLTGLIPKRFVSK